MKPLPLSFYLENDVVLLSQKLLGKTLFSQVDGTLTGGTIIETEAYRGPEDRASHAYNNRRTKRTEVMFKKGGICYVYLCYGIHHLLNVVTNQEGIPHAILIRALTPQFGIETMLKRRNKARVDGTLCRGPGSVCQALGVTSSHNGIELNSPLLWIAEGEKKELEIYASPRVGIDYAGEDATLPWRFRIK